MWSNIFAQSRLTEILRNLLRFHLQHNYKRFIISVNFKNIYVQSFYDIQNCHLLIIGN